MCTGQPCVVAQPHCGGIMGVRMGVMLGGIGCMMFHYKLYKRSIWGPTGTKRNWSTVSTFSYSLVYKLIPILRLLNITSTMCDDDAESDAVRYVIVSKQGNVAPLAMQLMYVSQVQIIVVLCIDDRVVLHHPHTALHSLALACMFTVVVLTILDF